MKLSELRPQQPEQPLDRVSALQLVCETASEWAGEYGFGMPEQARRVLAAVEIVERAPELSGPERAVVERFERAADALDDDARDYSWEATT